MRQELDNIIKKYDLINQTFENFWETYDTYLTDELTKEEREYNINQCKNKKTMYNMEYTSFVFNIFFNLSNKSHYCKNFLIHIK